MSDWHPQKDRNTLHIGSLFYHLFPVDVQSGFNATPATRCCQFTFFFHQSTIAHYAGLATFLS